MCSFNKVVTGKFMHQDNSLVLPELSDYCRILLPPRDPWKQRRGPLILPPQLDP